MKIVFLAPFGIRPKGTLIARMLPLADCLQSIGHRVVIVAPPYTNPEDSGKEEVVQGVLIRNVRLSWQNRALATPALTWRMLAALRQEQPDLVHLFKPKGYGGLAAMFLLASGNPGRDRPPVVVDTDDWEGTGGMNELHGYRSLEKRFYAMQENWLLRKADGVTVASRGLETEVFRLGIDPDRCFYLPNCVGEIKRESNPVSRQSLGVLEDTPVIILYTRFFEFGQERLHRVLAAVYSRLPGMRLLVVGRGRNNEEELLARAGANMGFAEAIINAGWVEPKDLPGYFALADLAIYPLDNTMINRCKCPAKLTELLSAGLPVVADRVGQAAEYIRHGESGILCDPEKPEEMIEAVLGLLADRERSRRLGAAGRSYLLEHFNWIKYAHGLHEFYEKSVLK